MAPDAGRVTFRVYAEEWRKIQTHRESTQLITESDLRLHVYPVIGDLPLNRILPSTLQAMVTGMDLSPNAVRGAMRPVKAVFRAAALDRKIGVDPTVALTYPPLVDKEMFIPTLDMVWEVRAALPDEFKILVDLLIGSGLRAGEIGALEVNHVDFLRRELHVRQQRVRPGQGEAYVCAPKTRSSRRTIPLANITLDALARHVEHHAGTVTVLDKLDPRNPHHRDARVLFPWPTAQPHRTAAPLEVRKVWNAAVRDANKVLAARDLPTFPEGRGSGLHCLRHFYASLLITAGESVTVVQRRLGPCQRHRDVEHLQPSVARQRLPHPRRHRCHARRLRTRSCGLPADWNVTSCPLTCTYTPGVHTDLMWTGLARHRP